MTIFELIEEDSVTGPPCKKNEKKPEALRVNLFFNKKLLKLDGIFTEVEVGDDVAKGMDIQG